MIDVFSIKNFRKFNGVIGLNHDKSIRDPCLREIFGSCVSKRAIATKKIIIESASIVQLTPHNFRLSN
jgi:hypothetical protein